MKKIFLVGALGMVLLGGGTSLALESENRGDDYKGFEIIEETDKVRVSFIKDNDLSRYDDSHSESENRVDDFKGFEIIEETDTVRESFIKDSDLPRYDDGPMDGGWWTRGKNGNNLISEYKHYMKQGRASCRNGNGTFSDGGWQSAGVWSKSKVGYTLFGGNIVYYDNR